MKKSMVCVMAGVLAASVLAGCGGAGGSTGGSSAASSTSGTSGSASSGLSIGFSGDYLNDFMSYVVDGVETACGDNGIQVTVKDAEFDSAKQLQQVENFINAGVDAVIIKPVDSSACGPIKQACEEAGVPFITVNQNSLDGQDVYVGSDHKYSGQLQGEYLVDALPEGGNVAILMGDLTLEATTDRTEGAKAVLEKAGNFTVISEQEAGWMRDEAMQKMENWLNSGLDIDAVIANNDEMAIGAANVLVENGITDVLVCGIDASEAALNLMKEGKMSMTVFQNGYQQGYQGVTAAMKLIAGETVEEYIDVPYETVLPEQADEYLAIIGN